MAGSQEIILHNYPQSPVAEKVRVVLGIKNVAWHSVKIPRLPPKPDVVKLTGGYRRTPIMQIGADVYCDSQCIIRELERRIPEPGLFPTSDAGFLWCLSRWADGVYFDHAVKVVLGAPGDALDPDFAADRGRLYMGPNWQEALKAANAELPHYVAQLRTQLMWLDAQLSDGRAFLSGDQPAAIDAQVYYAVWFLRGRWAPGAAFISTMPHLDRWADRVKAIGNGKPSPMQATIAAEIAAQATPRTGLDIDDQDPQGLRLGDRVIVSPDVDGGEQPVEGAISGLTSDTVTVWRQEPELGEIAVHFPRAGYKVSAAG